MSIKNNAVFSEGEFSPVNGKCYLSVCPCCKEEFAISFQDGYIGDGRYNFMVTYESLTPLADDWFYFEYVDALQAYNYDVSEYPFDYFMEERYTNRVCQKKPCRQILHWLNNRGEEVAIAKIWGVPLKRPLNVYLRSKSENVPPEAVVRYLEFKVRLEKAKAA